MNKKRDKADERDLRGPKYYRACEFGFRTEGRSDHKHILELLNIKTNDKVLEIGCGLGVLLNKIPAKKKIGTEINDFALKECRKRGLLVIRNDAEKGLPFRDSFFDIVILNEVMEHLRKPEFVLKECFRVLISGGRMIITTPARNFFVSNLSRTHFSEMSVSEAKELVQKCGFEILIQEVCGISFLYPFLENFFFKPFRLLKKIFNEKNKKTAGLIDNCHIIADKTLLRLLNFYRRYFLWLGQSQLILAQKR